MSYRLEQLFVKRGKGKGISVDNTVVLIPLVPTGDDAARAAHLAKIKPFKLQIYLDQRVEAVRAKREENKKKGGVIAA